MLGTSSAKEARKEDILERRKEGKKQPHSLDNWTPKISIFYIPE